eukprot:COSAG05_NODE_733_length_7644_cov_43.682704_4_plen_51_part_00
MGECEVDGQHDQAVFDGNEAAPTEQNFPKSQIGDGKVFSSKILPCMHSVS